MSDTLGGINTPANGGNPATGTTPSGGAIPTSGAPASGAPASGANPATGTPQVIPPVAQVPPGLEQIPLDQLPARNVPATDPKSLRKRLGLPSDAPLETDTATSGDVTPAAPSIFAPSNAPSLGLGAALPVPSIAGRAAPTTGGTVGLAAAATPNAIVLENQKPGNPASEWELSGAASSNIEGFTTDISYNLGQAVNFKINTNSNNYRIDIYRLGYYGGSGARRVGTVQHQTPSATVQPGPLRDPSTGLVDAGNWSVTDSFTLPSDAPSGVYIAKLVRQDGTFGQSHIPFIVRDDSSTSDIVFQTADTTWQAYNGWGGANLYGGNGPGGGSAPGRAFAVSYNRPIGTRDGIGLYSGPQDYVFGAEYAALRWMEQNGYDVSYISGVDASRNGALLLNHRIYTSTGHDEYWSGDQRRNVEAARDAGVNLAFMSGNEVYWKTRFAPSVDGSNTANRTLVSYKETREGPIDPSSEWTGTWRDLTFAPADAARPENGLTGTLFQVDSYRADTIEIPAEFSRLRFWRDTGVAAGQTDSLVQNYLGYEWDEAPDNGSRPPGLINLSSTTLSVGQYLTDFGTTTGNNTATHNLTLYRAPSGALVFGAGTVYWSWGLDANHDLAATPTDPNVRQAMVNLFADMGVQPQTLEASLRLASPSTDQTAPVSAINTPTVGASVGAGRQVTVSGSASDAGGGIVAGVEVSTDNGATWHPASGAAANWTYTWRTPAPGAYTVRSRAVDDSLNIEPAGPGVSVTVAPSPTVSLFQANDVPDVQSASDTGAVQLGVKFTSSSSGTVSGIRFFKGAQNTGTHVGSLWTATGTRLANATFTSETASGWQQVNFAAPVSIAAGTTYIASYHAPNGRYSITPNYFVQPHVSGELTAPVSGGPTAPNGVFAYGNSAAFPNQGLEAATNYWVDVVFNPAGAAGNQPPVAGNDSGFAASQNTALSIPASALLANDTDPNGDPLTVTGVSAATNGTVAYDAAAQAITFTPAAGYTGPAGFTYAVGDGRGGTASASVALTVSTAPPPTVGLFNPTDTPAVASDPDTGAVQLGVKFTSSQAGTVNGIRFFKGAQNTGTHVGSLWTATGTRLASATFTNETASGWQQVNFASPVSIAAGTTYIASYHAPNGRYAVDGNYFATARTNGPLTAPSSASSGGNGVYAYGNSAGFPSNTFNAANYWVDVAFSPAGGGGGTNQPPVAGNDSGFTTTQNTAVSIPASALLANDTDPNGDPLTVTGASAPSNGAVAYNAAAQAVTFTPAAGYTGPAGFTYAVGDGRGGTASATVALTVGAGTPPGAAVGLFNPTDTPAVASDPDTGAVQLGVKFTSSQAGTVNGIRFFKGAQNTGTHVGSLWTATGTRLASATFTNETASGWQQVNFAAPVSIAAGTTYIASYHAPNGRYAINTNYFATARTSGPLTAPSSASSGGNGVYAYGNSAGFPSNTFNAANYWVDVAFSPAGAGPSAGVAVTQSGGSTGVTEGGAGDDLAVALASQPSANVTVTVSGNADVNVASGGGAAGASATLAFTPQNWSAAQSVAVGAVNDALVEGPETASVSFATSSTDAAYNGLSVPPVSVAVTDNDTAAPAAGVAVTQSGGSTGVTEGGAGDDLAVALASQPSANVTVTVSGNADVNVASGGGAAGASATLAFTPQNWSAAQSVAVGAVNDALVEGPETASVSFATSSTDAAYNGLSVPPVSVAVTDNDTAAPAAGVAVTQSGGSTGVTEGGAGDDLAVALASQPSANVTVTVSGNADVNVASGGGAAGASATLAFTPQNWSAAQSVAVGAVNDALVEGPETASVSFATSSTDAAYNGLSVPPVSVAVTDNDTAAPATFSLFNPADTPAVASDPDTGAVQLGVKFTSSQAGTVNGIRFYKGAQNTGTHVGSLWTATGTRLASATFTNETASGWQQVNFASPVSIAAGTTYIASYHAPNGRYAADENYFSTARTSGPLTAPSSASSGGNGVYAYGGSAGFPSNTFNATNYWVDVVFQGQLAA